MVDIIRSLFTILPAIAELLRLTAIQGQAQDMYEMCI